jgi:DNA-binding MarR family transcriptional regulator
MSGQDPFIEALRKWTEDSMHRTMHAFIRQSRKSALSLSQINTLFRLYHHGSSPVNDLADHLGITMAAVSQLLAPLEEADLIERSEDPSDRRVKRIALTEVGDNRVQQIMVARHAWLDDFAALIPPDEKAALIPVLLRLNEYSQALNEKLGHYQKCASPTMKSEA